MSFPRYKENALSSDWYTKLVLTVLAVCAVVIATRELRGDGSRGVEEGRYRLQVMPMVRMMLKIDSQTGKTWRADFPDPRAWTQIAEDRVDVLDDEAPGSPDDADQEFGDEGQAAGELGAEIAPEAKAPESSAAP
jgi:hypothetical protein